MKVLAITGNPKKKGALATLVEEATRGAAAGGAEVEEIRIADRDIGYCKFCMTCREDHGPGIASCAQKDDMGEILEKIKDANAFILSCPMSSGHANAYMKTFIERCTWTLWRPAKNLLRLIGVQKPVLSDRQRYAVVITTTGNIPAWARILLNGSTREMSSLARIQFNAKVVGKLYAGTLFFHGLREKEKKKANDMGRALVEAVKINAKLAP